MWLWARRTDVPYIAICKFEQGRTTTDGGPGGARPTNSGLTTSVKSTTQAQPVDTVRRTEKYTYSPRRGLVLKNNAKPPRQGGARFHFQCTSGFCVLSPRRITSRAGAWEGRRGTFTAARVAWLSTWFRVGTRIRQSLSPKRPSTRDERSPQMTLRDQRSPAPSEPLRPRPRPAPWPPRPRPPLPRPPPPRLLASPRPRPLLLRGCARLPRPPE